MSTIPTEIDLTKLPAHLAVIMDGNGRWAKTKGLERIFGHQHAIQAVRDTVEGCAEMGIPYLSLYAFSTENWNRPQREVNALMDLLVSSINKEKDTLKKNKIRLRAVGNILSLPPKCQKELADAIQYTADGTRMTLILALSYSSRWEITEGVKSIARQVKEGTLDPEKIDEKKLSSSFVYAQYPDPELLIRTSGELRISNFMLWQLAYAEFYFTPVLWPDFRRNHLYDAIMDFQKRERRFGLTGEQTKSSKN